mmetsp:Transcript_22729/g.21954  ORF Transcript_22729/g.21954 Transcript_22729/m.21954 type:complete len:204 (+) Transcript_22729:85-696(+)
MSDSRRLKLLVVISAVATAIFVALFVYGTLQEISFDNIPRYRALLRYHLIDDEKVEDLSGRKLQGNVSTSEPSSAPSLVPFNTSSLPSSAPSLVPSSPNPSSSNASAPTSQPTSNPTIQPSTRPTYQPSTRLTYQPPSESASLINSKSSKNDRQYSDGVIVGIFFACLIFLVAIAGAAYYFKYRKIYNPLNEPSNKKFVLSYY